MTRLGVPCNLNIYQHAHVRLCSLGFPTFPIDDDTFSFDAR